MPVAASSVVPSAATTSVVTVAGGTKGAVRIRAGTTGASTLDVNQAIKTTASGTATDGGSVLLQAGGAITLATTNGTIDTTGNTTGKGGEVFIHHAGAGAGNITLDKSITAKGGVGGNGGVVTLLNDSGNIVVNAAVNVSRDTTGSDGTIQLKASGDITDTSSGGLIGDTTGSPFAYSVGQD